VEKQMDTPEVVSAQTDEHAPEAPLAERAKKLHFNNPKAREVHLRLFREWLPHPLQTAPGVDWDRLPSGSASN
jgi:hypothetical protein